MMTLQISGIVPVVAMPFTDDGQLDEASLALLCRHLAGTGVRGLMLFGIASEFHKLNDAEKQRAEQVFLGDWAPPSLLRIVAVTDQTWEVATESLARAEDAGATFAEVYQAIWMRYQTGSGEEAEALYRDLLPYVALWMQHPETIVAVEKWILQRRGIVTSAYCRGDRYQLDTQDIATAEHFLGTFHHILG